MIYREKGGYFLAKGGSRSTYLLGCVRFYLSTTINQLMEMGSNLAVARIGVLM